MTLGVAQALGNPGQHADFSFNEGMDMTWEEAVFKMFVSLPLCILVSSSEQTGIRASVASCHHG